MAVDEFEEVIRNSWARLYDEKSLRKRFIRTIKSTQNPTAATWSYASNVQYYNMFFEGLREPIDARDFFK